MDAFNPLVSASGSASGPGPVPVPVPVPMSVGVSVPHPGHHPHSHNHNHNHNHAHNHNHNAHGHTHPHGLSAHPHTAHHGPVSVSAPNDNLALAGQPQPMGLEFEPEIGFEDFPPMPNSFSGGLHSAAMFQQPAYEFESFATFEDPFPPYQRMVEPSRELDTFHEEEPSPRTLDNKLLGFSEAKASLVPIDDNGNFVDFGMSAELNGMFFVAEDVFGAENTGRPLELTCYRRNLWQCSGQVTLPRLMPVEFMGENGTRAQIVEYSASITASESIEHKPTEIISVPWKSAAAAAAASTNSAGHEELRQTATSPANITFDLDSAKEIDASTILVPLLWKRLQFKHATANNGRRKGQQQHYVVQITLMGKTGAGEMVNIASVESSPVIVRGRSPRNFDSRKDVPLVAERKLERKNTLTSNPGSERETSVPMQYGAAVQPQQQQQQQQQARYPSVPTLQVRKMRIMSSTQPDAAILRWANHSSLQAPTDWSSQTSPHPYSTPPNASSTSSNLPSQTPQLGTKQQLPTTASTSQQQHMSKKPALSPGQNRPPIPAWSKVSSSSASMPSSALSGLAGPAGASMGNGPFPLSLSEDERSPNRSSADIQSPQHTKIGMSSSAAPGSGVSGAGAAGGSQATVEDADMLYEYFPLSVDDWMPPVDAVYRPHVVHHTVVPPEIKAQQVQNKAKRYFVAE
ncbi:hypothetical protein BROUX41_005838 [Berkeleyomyces rouxiae]|uniref:uncharacterized protein n=1 Tax=Berkeleyomyces rouxiae TaxID=2035830 RepID=UPI003B7D3432